MREATLAAVGKSPGSVVEPGGHGAPVAGAPVGLVDLLTGGRLAGEGPRRISGTPVPRGPTPGRLHPTELVRTNLVGVARVAARHPAAY